MATIAAASEGSADRPPTGGREVDGPAPRREDVIRHREEVVRRLLDRGLSPSALHTMLPAFEDVIARVVAGRTGAPGATDGPGSAAPD